MAEQLLQMRGIGKQFGPVRALSDVTMTVAQGEIVKKLAGWAGLLALPTLIASWYGMNFAHMPELDKPYAYPLLIGTVLLACVVLYRYLRKVRWL